MATIGQILRDKDQQSKAGDGTRYLSVAEIKSGLRERDKLLGMDSSREAVIVPSGLDKHGNQKYTITYKHRRQAPRGSALEQKKAALKEKIQSMRNKEMFN